MSARFVVVAGVAAALAAAAIAGSLEIETRASTARAGQLELAHAASTLNNLQSLPWRAELGGDGRADLHARLLAGGNAVLSSLDRLQRRTPNHELGPLRAAVIVNLALLNRISVASDSTVLTRTGPVALVSAQARSAAVVEHRTEVAGESYARNARQLMTVSDISASGAIVLLLGAFLVFYRRSSRALVANQQALTEKEAAHEILLERDQELSDTLGRLEAANGERDRLLARTVEVAEHERIVIAGELHDGPIQQLTVIAFALDHIGRRLGSGRPAGLEVELAELRLNVSGQMSSLRRMMAELRPPVLDEGGIGAAVGDLAQTILGETAVSRNVQNTIGNVRFAPEVETVLYRVAREALMNVRKHAHATHVEITLERRGRTLRLIVADNGHGFDQARPSYDAGEPHLGLVGIEERLSSVGGDWSVRSSSDLGTRCKATLPWKPRLLETSHESSGLVAV